ncbi:c-type cytochrome [Alkalimarinus alittae]|uniref:Cytochrome c n=1 Tax=Alkalimarinus alittae TaxID=2961619 RepID=A0ABY6N5I9_9ALTE|nr:cytochrome c [Alkalimarinus alittae]UZE97383.1 cytochrome c [Alkalimarinus alittae]
MINDDKHTQLRENPEPEEGTLTTPKAVLAWIFILIVWGVGYYAWQIGKPMLGGDSRTAVAAPPQSPEESLDGTIVAAPEGKTVFSAHCAACHQATGQGIPGAFPPLAGSQWVTAEDSNLPLAIIHDGLSGEIEVAGNTYNGIMPSFKGTLSSAELAAVLTYIRQNWGNNAEAIDASIVEKHNEVIGDRDPWTVNELKQTFQTP